jgi:hypothetical protein
MLNFEIVSSSGSSTGYGRISQREEISYGFVYFVTHSFCKALVLRWQNVNLFVNIILGPIFFQHGTYLLPLSPHHRLLVLAS